MFDLDKWQEIFATIAKNKLRTFLTAFSVAWGIFMLVILLGAGNGLRNGVLNMFKDDAINSISVRSGQTSLPHNGLQPGRNIQFTNEDFDVIKDRVDGVEYITSRFNINAQLTISYGTEYGAFSVRSVHPEHKYLEKTLIQRGRFINELDIKYKRKVTSIGYKVKDALFFNEDPIGKYIKINGIAFKVVGIFEDDGQEGETEILYLPVTTAQQIFNGANRVNQILLTVGDADLEESIKIADEIKLIMSQRHNFDVNDPKAAYIRNSIERFQQVAGILLGIKVFIWIIGIGTILAGVVGVGNIMMILVKERTREIGVRKALGATPMSIVGLIIQESVFITSLAGYLGLLGGIGLLSLVSAAIPPDTAFFANPEIELTVAIQAVVLLVFAGACAGLIPSIKAAKIRPIEALRDA